MLTPNTLIYDRYRVVRVVGQGSTGTVYQAVDQQIGRTVALKQIPLIDEAQGDALAAQAQQLVALDHPVLPKIFDDFVGDNELFVVMEFVPGVDLYRRLQQHGMRFTVGEVLHWADQMLDALAYLHAQTPPVLHGNIQPQNLILTPRGQIMLLNFGLVQQATDDQASDATAPQLAALQANDLDSPYLPPEQLEGVPRMPGSDLYALAATLYTLLTSQMPPDAQTRAEAYTAGQTDPLTPAHKLHDEVPAGVSDVLVQAMALDIAERPESAAAMRTALQSVAPRLEAVPEKTEKTTKSRLKRISPPPQQQPAVSPPPAASPEPTPPPPPQAGPNRPVGVTAPLPEPYADDNESDDRRGVWMIAGGVLVVLVVVVLLTIFLSDTTTTAQDSSGAASVANGVPRTPTATMEAAALLATTTPTRTPEPGSAAITAVGTPEEEDEESTPTGTPEEEDGEATPTGTPEEEDEEATPTSTPEEEEETPTSTPEEEEETPTSTPEEEGGEATPTGTPEEEETPTSTPEEEEETPTSTPEPTATATIQALPVQAGTPVLQPEAAIAPDTAGLVEQLAQWQAHEQDVFALAVSSDNQTLATGGLDNLVRLWDWTTGTMLLNLERHTDAVWSVVFSPDGQTLASASGSVDGTIRLWNVADGTMREALVGHVDGTSCLAFSPNGQIFASGSWDTTIRVWNAADGALISTLEGHAAPVLGLAFSPDGQVLASASEDGTVRLWDMSDGSVLDTLDHTDPVWSVAFSPGGEVLATGSSDGAVNLWQIEGGEASFIQFMEGHAAEVQDVAFSLDGQVLASGSSDSTVRLWNVAEGSLYITLEGHIAPVTGVAFAPDGRHLFSSAWDGTVSVWGVVPEPETQTEE
jgi:WD40 repeat protein/serine/threonine protein kinase